MSRKNPEEYKEYQRQYQKEYRKNNKEKIKEREKKYKEKHKERIKEYLKEYKDTHKEQIKENDKKYKERHKEYLKKYRDTHKEYFKEYRKEYVNDPDKRQHLVDNNKSYNEETRPSAHNHRQIWTREEVDILIELKKRNVKGKDIAARLGRTLKAVQNMENKIRRKGHPFNGNPVDI